MASVVATAFRQRLPDARKIIAIQKWREAIDLNRAVRVARMREQ
jgi:hypothetical protein